MSNLTITELGRKWYGVSVNFENEDIDRITPDALRGMGGKLRYNSDGGLRALFHFNVTRPESSEEMIKVLKYFGKDGYFQQGVDLKASTETNICESETAINAVISRLNTSCRSWSEQWKHLTENAVNLKRSRVQLLRSIQDLGTDHISEQQIRDYAEDILRSKYNSELFVETFMWRLGWPDKRKPFSTLASRPMFVAAG